MREWLLVSLLLVASALSGCATYRPMPLGPERVAQALASPNMESVRTQTGKIEHPILKPIAFDDRNGLSLDEAAILAVIANPRLRAVRDRKGIAAAQLLQAGILPNPQLSYDLETPTEDEAEGSANGSETGLSWDITSLIIRNVRIDGARAHSASVDLEVAWQEWQTAEAARFHVYRLLIAQKRLAAAREKAASCRTSYKLIQQGVTLGEKTNNDLSAARCDLNDAELLVLDARSEAEEERLTLNQTLGLPAGKYVALEKDIEVPLSQEIASEEILLKGIEERRLDILALKIGYESQEAKVRAAIRSQFPRIGIGLSGAKGTDGQQSAIVGVTIDLPFFDRNQGRIAVERATRKQLWDEYAARLFEASGDTVRILNALRSTRKQITTIDSSLQELERLVRSFRGASDEGRSDILSYQEILSRFQTKKIERIGMEKQLMDLVITLEIASGQQFRSEDTSQVYRPKDRKEMSK